jgi:hypothetical protein
MKQSILFILAIFFLVAPVNCEPQVRPFFSMQELVMVVLGFRMRLPQIAE